MTSPTKHLLFSLLALLAFTGWGCDKQGCPPIKTEPDPTDSTDLDTSKMLTCEDTIDINYPGYMTSGYLESIKTCRSWKASGKLALTGTFHFTIQAETYFLEIEDGDTSLYLAEVMRLIVPRKTGRFPLINNSVTGTFYDKAKISFRYFDDDAVLATWNVDDSATSQNWIEIDEIDYVGRKVKGRFSANLKTNFLSDSPYPDYLSFYDGTFNLVIP